MLVVVTVCAFVLAGCVSPPPTNRGGQGSNTAGGSQTDPGASRNPSECEYVEDDNASKDVDLPPMTDVVHTGTAEVTLETEAGPLVITLDREAAPCTVNSFISLSEQQFYDDTECHRMSDEGIFILQCGDPTGTGTGGPGYQFADELNEDTAYPAGTIAMANSGENTNGSQFFLVFRDTPLSPDYTSFGHLDEDSLGVLLALVQRGHDASYEDGSGRPTPPITIAKASLTGQSSTAPSASPTANSSGR